MQVQFGGDPRKIRDRILGRQSKEVVLNWKRRTVMRLSRREETRLLKAATRVLLEG